MHSKVVFSLERPLCQAGRETDRNVGFKTFERTSNLLAGKEIYLTNKGVIETILLMQ